MRILSYSLLCLTLLTGLGLPVFGRHYSSPSTATDGNSGGLLETESNKGKPEDIYDKFDESSGRRHGQGHDSTSLYLRRSRSGQKNKILKSTTLGSVVNGIDIGSKSKTRKIEKDSGKSPQASRRTSSTVGKKKRPRDMIAALLTIGDEDRGKATKSPKGMVTKLLLKGKGKKNGKGTKAPKQNTKSKKSQKTQQPSVSQYPTSAPIFQQYLMPYCAEVCVFDENNQKKLTKSVKKLIKKIIDDENVIRKITYQFLTDNCQQCNGEARRKLAKDENKLRQNTVIIDIEFENDIETAIPDSNTIANFLNENRDEIEKDLKDIDLDIKSIDVASNEPSLSPTDLPSLYPSSSPTDLPSLYPSSSPTDLPSLYPSSSPTSQPSKSQFPSVVPSLLPTSMPSDIPSDTPSDQPSSVPSSMPSDRPSDQPSLSDSPSDQPSLLPSSQPSSLPSVSPSLAPSALPSSFPSSQPSKSQLPSVEPSLSLGPTLSDHPSLQPSSSPSSTPTTTLEPSLQPSSEPSLHPSSGPSSIPSRVPSFEPSDLPSLQPSISLMPSQNPTATNLKATVVCKTCTSTCLSAGGDTLTTDEENVFNEQMKNVGLQGVYTGSILSLKTSVTNDDCTPCQNSGRRFLQDDGSQVQSTIVIEVEVQNNETVTLPDPLTVTQNMEF